MHRPANVPLPLQSSAPPLSRSDTPRHVPPDGAARSVTIGRLQSAIRQIERRAGGHVPWQGAGHEAGDAVDAPFGRTGSAICPQRPPFARRAGMWTLGDAALDDVLPDGFDCQAVHEIKGAPHEAGRDAAASSLPPGLRRTSAAAGAGAGDWMAGLGFALRLAVRRVLGDAGRLAQAETPWLLWCWPKVMAQEFGGLSAAGLVDLGLDPCRVIIVETGRVSEALNAMEEALKSGSLGLVAGVFDEVGLTPARRLNLAAAAGATPCLLVTHPQAQPAAATATRWRIARRESVPHADDARAPGAPQFDVSLERCRNAPALAARSSLSIAWCSDACRFHLVSGLADHTACPRRVA